jgi:ankyrin repeat protein
VLPAAIGFAALAYAGGIGAFSPDQALADAMERSDIAAVRSLLDRKAEVDAAQSDGMTALHWAVRHDDIASAKMLLAAGARAAAATRYGVTPIYLAALNGNAAIIDLLLKAGVDAKAANPGGETALMTASRTGKLDAVKLLIDRGADLNAKEGERGHTALMWAVLENHPEVVKLLVARGADINAQSKVDIPDGVAAQPRGTSGDIGAHGPGFYRSRAVPSPSGALTALAFAAREGNLPMVRLLAELKADMNIPSANGTPPLTVAIVNNHIELAIFLIERGADIQTADRFHKRTPLFAAIERRDPDYMRDTAPPTPDAKDPTDLIRMLLDRGANPNVQVNTVPVRGFMQVSANWVNFDGQTPFLRAALAGDVELMRLLLAHGADPNIKTLDGANPLMAAAGLNWVVGQTFSRSDEEYLEAAKLCIEKGNDVNAVDSRTGLTAMHGAANRGFDAMIRLLAANGARLDAADKQRRTPMTYAEGVFLAVQPPVSKPSTIALLKELMAASASNAERE